MGRVLTLDEIAELTAPKKKVKDKPQTVRFPAPPQHGPLRYMETSDLCVVAGYWSYPENNEEKVWMKTKGCRTQTHYRLEGIPMCCTHALRMMNEMLHDKGFDYTELILDEKTVQQIEHEAVQARLIRGNERLAKQLQAALDNE